MGRFLGVRRLLKRCSRSCQEGRCDVVELINAWEQVDLDYARARRRAKIGKFLARVRRRCASLRAFDDALRELGAENRRYLGRRTVEVRRVVGSVGRWKEFDGEFRPTKASRERWKRVDLAFRTGQNLPPVVLYKVGDDYYVHDGNHRVSVARLGGAEWVDAEVTEFFPSRRAESSGGRPDRCTGGPTRSGNKEHTRMKRR